MSATRYCSFCGKSEHDILALVAGPTAFICNECVILVVDIMLEKMTSQKLKDYVMFELGTRMPPPEPPAVPHDFFTEAMKPILERNKKLERRNTKLEAALKIYEETMENVSTDLMKLETKETT